MRQIVLDTETTGLDPRQGHRIIEVAGLELINRRPTGRHFHEYIHPDREIDPGAQAVHGISLEFLADKPRFEGIVDALVEFIAGAELVIHNAQFDTGFMDAEFARLSRPPTTAICPSVIDTLKMAKTLHPGKRNNLDALCERYAVDNTGRTLHGALLDAELLADVYLAMTRGQNTLMIEAEHFPETAAEISQRQRDRKPLKVLTASTDELALHNTVLGNIQKESKGACLWLQTPAPRAPSETA